MLRVAVGGPSALHPIQVEHCRRSGLRSRGLRWRRVEPNVANSRCRVTACHGERTCGRPPPCAPTAERSEPAQGDACVGRWSLARRAQRICRHCAAAAAHRVILPALTTSSSAGISTRSRGCRLAPGRLSIASSSLRRLPGRSRATPDTAALNRSRAVRPRRRSTPGATTCRAASGPSRRPSG